MDETNEKMGLLMLIDDIGLLISTFGVLLIFYLIMGPTEISKNVFIITLFFAGIKILLTGIGDITGVSRKLWASILFVVIADAVIILVNRFMSFGISNRILLITMAADIVVTVICLMIWKRVVGKEEIQEDENRRAWVRGEEKTQPAAKEEAHTTKTETPAFEEGEYESLFEEEKPEEKKKPAESSKSLGDVEEEQEEEQEDLLFGGNVTEEQAKPKQPVGAHAFTAQEEGGYERLTENVPEIDHTDLFADLFASETAEHETVKETEPDQEEAVEESSEQVGAQKEAAEQTAPEETPVFEETEAPVEETPVETKTVEEEVQTPAETEEAVKETVEETPVEETAAPVEAVEDKEDKTEEKVVEQTSKPEELTDEDVAQARKEAHEIPREVTEQVEDEICKELDALYARMQESSSKSKVLEDHVSSFSKEVDEMPALTSTEDIIESGKLIRSKLRTIIDKQFVMDDVLKEVIETSDRINQRVDKLNRIEKELRKKEEELNKREEALKQPEVDVKEVILNEPKEESTSLFENFTKPIEPVNSEAIADKFTKAVNETKKTRKISRHTKKTNQGEVLLQNDEYEIIINEKDLDLVREYLANNGI